MGDKETSVKFGADISGLKTGMSQASASVAGAVDAMKWALAQGATASEGLADKMTQAFSQVAAQSKISTAAVSNSVTGAKDSMVGLGEAAKMLTGLLAGALSVGAMKSAIDAATSYNASIISLSRVMGTTTEQASVLATAIKIIGGTTEEYASINMKLAMHVKGNSDALEQLGVTLKDGNGHLLSQQEIFDNSIKAMNEYKEGADRNQFALYAFGRSAQEVYKYQQLNNDVMAAAAEMATKYGLVVGGEAAEKTRLMSMEVNKLGIIFDAMKIAVGSELLPVLVNFAGNLGELAKGILPQVSTGLKNLATMWEVWRLAVEKATVYIAASLAIISDTIAYTAKAALAFARGDFQGAWDAIKDGYNKVKADVQAASEQMAENEKKAAARIKDIWSKITPGAASAAPKGTKPFEAPDTKKGKEDPSRLGEWRDQLEQKKMDEKAYFDFSTEREKTFWAEKLALTKTGSKERFEVNHVIFELEKKDVQQEIKDEETRIASANKLAEESAAAKQREVDTKFKLGEISAKDQIKQEQDIQNNLFAIQTENFSKLEALAEKYPSIWERVQAQIEASTQKHNEKIIGLNDKLSLETKKTFDSILGPVQSAISTSVKGIILGTTTLKKAIDNLGVSILASFIDMCSKELMNWISKEAMKLGISEMYSKMMIALGLEEAVEKEAVATPSAVSMINKHAAVAAAGAAEAMASIPYVGPALAIAAAAETFAMVQGYQSFAVAAGGFDVPAGISPLTQLHPQEMVLPANLAENVRNMTGGGGNTVIHINGALDAKSWSDHHGRNLLKGLSRSVNRLGIRR
jgi:hypothetical protein